MLFQGSPKEGILQCSVADDNTFSDNVFLKKQLTMEAEKDFEAVKNNNFFDIPKRALMIIRKVESRAVF